MQKVLLVAIFHVSDVAHPIIADLLKEIQIVFDIPRPLPSFVILDPTEYPTDSDELQSFRNNEIEDLCDFYGGPKQYRNSVDTKLHVST